VARVEKQAHLADHRQHFKEARTSGTGAPANASAPLPAGMAGARGYARLGPRQAQCLENSKFGPAPPHQSFWSWIQLPGDPVKPMLNAPARSLPIHLLDPNLFAH
jgi:hypothetical protein